MPHPTGWRALATAAACATLLVGCSGPENTDPGAKSGAEGVSDVVGVYAAALADGDGPRACSLMNPPAQQELIARVGVDGTASPQCPRKRRR